jgi:hypothetical protein
MRAACGVVREPARVVFVVAEAEAGRLTHAPSLLRHPVPATLVLPPHRVLQRIHGGQDAFGDRLDHGKRVLWGCGC